MMNKANFWKFSVVSSFTATLVSALLAASCGHPTGSGGTCSGGAGSELCPCQAGNVCNTNLVCATDRNECVSLSGAGGTTGAAGTSGTAGTNGNTGTAGTTATGTAGATGNSGTAGTTGTTGVAGTNGAAGTNGVAGTSGAAGTNGVAGTTGTSGGNLITNGDFSMGMNNWGVAAGNPNNPGVNNGQFCVTLNGSGNVILGWGGASMSMSLMANINYTLAFQVSSTGALSDFEVHVGSAVAVPAGSTNYPIDHMLSPQNAPGTSLTNYTDMFSIGTGDPQAGLAFQFAASTGNPTVCIDNISLTAH